MKQFRFKLEGLPLAPVVRQVAGLLLANDCFLEKAAIWIEQHDGDETWFFDPLRRFTVRNRCPFPFCVRDDFHTGDHELWPMRPGDD